MNDAAIVPMVYAKALIYRPPSLTNVYVIGRYGDVQLRRPRCEVLSPGHVPRR